MTLMVSRDASAVDCVQPAAASAYGPVSIVSDSCWGREAYRHLGQEYRSPFIGLFVVPQCYAALVADLRRFLESPLDFQRDTRYPGIAQKRANGALPRYPVARLDSLVEIHFLHYPSAKVAQASWQRRLGRFDWSQVRIQAAPHGQGGTSEVVNRIASRPDAVVFRRREVAPLNPASHRSSSEPKQQKPEERIVDINEDLTDGHALFERTLRYFDFPLWIRTGRIQRAG